MNVLLAAILGALLTGGVQTLLRYQDRASRRRTLLRAPVTEVATPCQFIRLQRYVESYGDAAAAARRGEPATMLPIAAKQRYFTMYETIGADIGLLPTEIAAAAVVRFYTVARIALDTARPDSIFVAPATKGNLLFMRDVAQQLLETGDRLVQMAGAPVLPRLHQ